jgi:hypothetical protein
MVAAPVFRRALLYWTLDGGNLPRQGQHATLGSGRRR